MRGYVYLLTNPSMPGLIKIGHTHNAIDVRLKQLNSTGVPASFELEACFAVVDAARVEKGLHALLNSFRYATNREFFMVSVQHVYELAIPFIAANAINTSASESVKESKKSHDLDEESVCLLQILAGPGRDYGFPERELVEATVEPPLKTEVRLAGLLEKKLVVQKKALNEWNGPMWHVTAKGKKFLADHGLITDEMLPK